MSAEEFLRDWTPADIRQMVYDESDTDMLVAMPLPLTDLFRDGLSPWETCAELASRDPDRTVFWGSVNPLEGRKALDLMERQVGEFGAKAFKFYNVRYDYGSPFPWRMDDPQVAFPIFEKAQELGINLIGVHKGVPLGPQPIEATQTWDMDGAAANFPDINFVIFHVGLPFIDETCWQLIRYPNLYASIAATINFVVRAPRLFAEIIGKLLFWCGEDKIIYGSEAPIWQPQWALQAFMDFRSRRTCATATATRSSPTWPSARSSARTCCGCTAWTSRRRRRAWAARSRTELRRGRGPRQQVGSDPPVDGADDRPDDPRRHRPLVEEKGREPRRVPVDAPADDDGAHRPRGRLEPDDVGLRRPDPPAEDVVGRRMRAEPEAQDDTVHDTDQEPQRRGRPLEPAANPLLRRPVVRLGHADLEGVRVVRAVGAVLGIRHAHGSAAHEARSAGPSTPPLF